MNTATKVRSLLGIALGLGFLAAAGAAPAPPAIHTQTAQGVRRVAAKRQKRQRKRRNLMKFKTSSFGRRKPMIWVHGQWAFFRP